MPSVAIRVGKTGKLPLMKKLHQNRLDRFSVMAKKLVDDRSAELHLDLRKPGSDDVYDTHRQTLGEQLEANAREFLESCKINNDQFINDVWGTCKRYLELFDRINQKDPLAGL